MEHLNFDDIIYQTIHSEYTLKIAKSNNPPKGTRVKIDREAWNTYGCEWDSEKIVFTVNGRATHTYPRMPELGAKQWTFDEPFYFILSMQVGGSWVNSAGPTRIEGQGAVEVGDHVAKGRRVAMRHAGPVQQGRGDVQTHRGLGRLEDGHGAQHVGGPLTTRRLLGFR